MNILIPHSWLLDHLQTTASPKELQRIVSLSGPSVERIYERNGDLVYDVEITTNRVDSMSIRGFAREAAVILHQKDQESVLKPITITLDSITKNALNNDHTDTSSELLPLPKILDHPSLNKRTMCVVLDSVARNATPDWMIQRLEQIEMNVHDAAIDITNYVTHELGHPCHAFDYDVIMEMGGEIHIVEAQVGETFTTLDGETYTTKGGEVVFKNQAGTIIDLPSIKGTLNSAVSDTTKRILLFIESIEPEKVRFASMSHAIRTTAAQLMEKNLDPHLADDTFALAIHLYQELCSARVASSIYDSFTDRVAQEITTSGSSVANHPIIFPLGEVHRYLGISLSRSEITAILEQLGCTVSDHQSDHHSAHQTDTIAVSPPSFRSDLHSTADLIEEIARIYGYHELPSKMLESSIPTNYQTHSNYLLEDSVKNLLSNTGWQEAYTYSMVSEQIAKNSGFSLDSHLKLTNPLTEDMVYLRRSLIPSLVEMIESNVSYHPLSVFEMACTYQPQSSDIPTQPFELCLVSNQDYKKVKGSVEAILESLFISETEMLFVRDIAPVSGFSQSASIQILHRHSNTNTDSSTHSSHDKPSVNKTTIGTIGILQATSSNTKHSLFTSAVLDWESIVSVAKRNPTYQPLPKTSVVTEDITFTVPEKTEIASLLHTIRNSHTLIKKVTYTGKYMQNISFTITFFDTEKHISSDDLEPIRKRIVQEMEQHHQAILVGEV